MLDLFLFPTNRIGGQDVSSPQGFAVSSPPRLAKRGRHSDRLIVHLSFQNKAVVSGDFKEKLLASVVKKYYKTPGSSTAALRAAAEALNLHLLKWNRNRADQSPPLIGQLAMAVIREKRLYLMMVGSSHVFLLQPDGVRHFYDVGSEGRGLGLGKSTPYRFYQAMLNSSDIVLMTSHHPEAWTENLLHQVRKGTFDDVYQTLFPDSITDIDALVIKAKNGNGQIKTIPWEKAGLYFVGKASGFKITGREAEKPVRVVSGSTQKASGEPSAQVASQTPVRETRVKQHNQWVMTKAAPFLKRTYRFLGTLLRNMTNGFLLFAKRMLPDESLFTIPSSVMLLVAVLVPIIVVGFAGVVYFQRGKGSLYMQNYLLAQESAQEAVTAHDTKVVREKWLDTLRYLDIAEKYKTTKESKALREYANEVLDQLDIVARVEYIPAIGERFPEGTVITRILAGDDGDLYLLNGAEGNVFHAIYTGEGYSLDKDFLCGPITAHVVVGPIIDIALLPKGNVFNADMLGMDKDGNIIGCSPGEDAPFVEKLGTPTSGWGSTISMFMDGSDLYVLDAKKNSIWIYWGSVGLKKEPTPFFFTETPDLSNVIDIVAHDGDLFLLHNDGKLNKCIFSALLESPSYCEEPVSLVTTGAGSDGIARDGGTHFSEMRFLPPPDPSLYFLDPEQQAIFHYSLRLRYLGQIKPIDRLDVGEATAFAISRTRMIYLAFADKIYYAPLP